MKQKPLFIRIAWKIVFTIFYPIITAFSVVFMWLIGLLSSISSLIVKLAKKIYPN
jgi:hypothetical protein